MSRSHIPARKNLIHRTSLIEKFVYNWYVATYLDCRIPRWSWTQPSPPGRLEWTWPWRGSSAGKGALPAMIQHDLCAFFKLSHIYLKHISIRYATDNLTRSYRYLISKETWATCMSISFSENLNKTELYWGVILRYFFWTIKHSLNVGKQIWSIERVYVRFNIKKDGKCASGA